MYWYIPVYQIYNYIYIYIIFLSFLLGSGVFPQGLFFSQKVHFLNLGVLLYQGNEHIGTIGTK